MTCEKFDVWRRPELNSDVARVTTHESNPVLQQMRVLQLVVESRE